MTDPIRIVGTDGRGGRVETEVDPDSPTGQLVTAGAVLGLSLAGADDDTPVARQLSMLSKADLATLRRLSGNLTLADWMATPADARGAWRVKDRRVLHACAMRVLAVQTAQRTARLAPWVLVPQVRL